MGDHIAGHPRELVEGDRDHRRFHALVDARETTVGHQSSVKRLRIALFIDDWRVPNWIASIAADVVASDACEIAAVVLNGPIRDKGRVLPYYRPQPNPFRLARLYLYLDYWLFHRSADALDVVDLKGTLKAYPVIQAEPVFDGSFFRFTERDQNRLRECDIDVLLLFWSGLPAHQVLPLARHGVWFFLDHQLLFTGHVPTGFWEVLNQRPITMQCLQAQLASSPRATVLHQHYGPMRFRSITLARNNLLWKSASFVSRKLDELQRSGSFDVLAITQRCDRDSVPDETTPSNVMMVKTIGSHVSRFVRDRANNLRYFDQWVMAYKYTSGEFLDRDFAAYHWLIPPKDRGWADPFPVQAEGHDFLFFEEFVYAEKKGHLCVALIDRKGLKDKPKTILKCDYHLSYPFIFSWQGEWYLIPETHEANRIDVYRFDAFPYKVSFYKTLMDNVKACDTTLFEADGRWWMFTAIAFHGTWNVDELFLFCADNPFGPWVPHRQNPIKSDVRSARPAGRVFRRQGKYYRPSQDCSQGYGYAIRVQEIQALSDANYAEQEVEAILPDWSSDVVATHTLNVADTLSVIDAKKRRRR